MKRDKISKYTTADKKGFVLIGALVVAIVCLVVFCSKAIRTSTSPAQTTLPASTTTVQQSSTVPSTSAPTTTAPSTSSEPITTTEQVTSTTEKDEPSPSQPQTSEKAPDDYSKDEILAKIRNGVNSLKSENASFTAVKTQTLYIQVDELSVPFMLSTVNAVISAFTGDEEVSEFDFTNGVGYDPEDDEETSSLEAIPPTLRQFTLNDVNGLAQAQAEQVSDGIKFTIKLVPESSTLENPRPQYHGAACDVLDFSVFELPVGEVTKADFTYPGATISVIVNSRGEITEYYEYMPMSAVGEAGAFNISGSGTMSGYVEEKWVINWK